MDEIISKFKLSYPIFIINRLINISIEHDRFNDKNYIMSICEKIKEKKIALSAGISYYIGYSKQNHIEKYNLVIKMDKYGLIRSYEFEDNFFKKGIYQRLFNLNKILNMKIKRNATIEYKNNIYKFENMKDCFNKIFSIVNKTQQIQRFKGLGEMNPKQLWDTTMDPNSRRMLKVKIESDMETDKIFSTLMGNNVDVRKKFIQENSLLVNNLDV